MKKFQMLIISTILVFAFGCLQSIAQAAEVIFVQGNVQVQSPNESDWRKAEKGMQLNIGDTVRTARHSKIDIVLDADKKNTIQLGEKTLAVLNSATADTIDRLELSRGRVYSNLEGIKAGMDFEVTTPSAVAGVRGSSYMVYVEPDQDEVSAYKDTIFIKSFDADKKALLEIMLPEGFRTFIERFQEPSALLQVSLREFERFDNIRSDMRSRIEGREPVRHEKEHRGALGEEKSVIERLTEQQGIQQDNLDLTDERNTEEQTERQTTPPSEPPSEYH